MKINVFVKNKTIISWLEKLQEELSNNYSLIIHTSIFSFVNELKLKEVETFSIIDIHFPNWDHHTRDIISSNPNCKIIGISLHRDCESLLAKVDAGIVGYTSIYSNSFDFVKLIDNIKLLKYSFPLSAYNKLIDDIQMNYFNLLKQSGNQILNNQSFHQTVSGVLDVKDLTEKEAVVCKLLTKGHSYKEIAEIIGLTTFSVNQKAKSIYKKIGVRSRAELSYRILS
jgi:DNA-binding NarL/FixJ family response regulator